LPSLVYISEKSVKKLNANHLVLEIVHGTWNRIVWRFVGRIARVDRPFTGFYAIADL
jgi:hypothetical protein